MFIAYTPTICNSFRTVSVTKIKRSTKTTALEVVRRYLLDEVPYDEVDMALCWLEDEYPLCRKTLMQLRCCFLYEELMEYEEHLAICARHVLDLRCALK